MSVKIKLNEILKKNDLSIEPLEQYINKIKKELIDKFDFIEKEKYTLNLCDLKFESIEELEEIIKSFQNDEKNKPHQMSSLYKYLSDKFYIELNRSSFENSKQTSDEARMSYYSNYELKCVVSDVLIAYIKKQKNPKNFKELIDS